MERKRARSGTSLSFWILIIGLIGLGIYSMVSLNETKALYDSTLMMQNSLKDGNVAKVEFPGAEKPLNVPDWALLRDGNIWSLVSRNNPLPTHFKTPDLTTTTVAHGDSGSDMKVQQKIEAPLRALFAAAETDGVELMLSSAYRSIDEQTKLYDQFVDKQGAAMAAQYVAKPGSSEHHTGLSIDFATASGPCQADSDKCSLATVDAEWLLENAPKFGFIQRYPEGKQPLTGVAFEPWHYRYVGVPMALAISQSDLTYDEAVRQFAPGYVR